MRANRRPGSRWTRALAASALSSAALLGPLSAAPAPAAAVQATPTRANATRANAVQAKVSHEVATRRANAAASRARARVDALVEEYQATSARVDDAVRALTTAFAAGDAAEVDDDEAAGQERRILASQSAQVRAVYVAGGPAGLTGSVLAATSPDDALWRVSTAERVLGVLFADTRDRVSTQVELATVARRRATAAGAAVEAQAAALNDLQRQATDAAALLTQAQATLATLDTRAREAKAAQEAARQIAAAAAAARAATRTALGQVTALGIPTEYQIAYQAAALTCPGLPWTLLAGVGQVETGHGRNSRPSSAGAIGPMQFMPRTFAAYAVDGDQDGVLDAWDPQDAIFSAAHYLCESGAEGGSAAGIQTALLAYNHAQWYVDLVLATEQAIIQRTADRQ
jgi:membrane-bound lytic murein transglycosylase B